MDRTRLQISPGIRLDARRAVWLENEGVLAVADLHLGYAWAQRTRGQLLPISAVDRTVESLLALVEDYRPRELALLGDIVHRAVPLEPLREELRALHERLALRTSLRLIAGNHDRHLASLLRESGADLPLATEFQAGPHRLLHGDALPEEERAMVEGAVTLMGHEHPAIRLGDGVSEVKCACFLVARDLIVLPAFSPWAAGVNIRTGKFLSPLARAARFERAVAILAGKLLPVAL